MKRRAHYILDKLNLNNENQKNTNKENIAPSTSSAEENPDTFILIRNQMITENTPETENKTSTPSPSVIENSPDKSIPNFDPKTIPLYNTKTNEIQMLIKIEDFTKEPITSDQANSSSSTCSCSSSSSRSSSSSSSSSSNSSSRINNSNAHSIIDGPSTSKLPNQVASRNTNVNKNYHQSPINSNESDVDLSDSDPTYSIDRSRSNLRKTRISSSSSSSSSSTNTAINADNSNNNSVPETTRSSRKRTRDPSKWKQNLAKHLRNSGKEEEFKEVPARCIKDACKCRLKCLENIDNNDRNTLFELYWSLSNIELQRNYTLCNKNPVVPLSCVISIDNQT